MNYINSLNVFLTLIAFGSSVDGHGATDPLYRHVTGDRIPELKVSILNIPGKSDAHSITADELNAFMRAEEIGIDRLFEGLKSAVGAQQDYDQYSDLASSLGESYVKILEKEFNTTPSASVLSAFAKKSAIEGVVNMLSSAVGDGVRSAVKSVNLEMLDRLELTIKTQSELIAAHAAVTLSTRGMPTDDDVKKYTDELFNKHFDIQTASSNARAIKYRVSDKINEFLKTRLADHPSTATPKVNHLQSESLDRALETLEQIASAQDRQQKSLEEIDRKLSKIEEGNQLSEGAATIFNQAGQYMEGTVKLLRVIGVDSEVIKPISAAAQGAVILSSFFDQAAKKGMTALLSFNMVTSIMSLASMFAPDPVMEALNAIHKRLDGIGENQRKTLQGINAILKTQESIIKTQQQIYSAVMQLTSEFRAFRAENNRQLSEIKTGVDWLRFAEAIKSVERPTDACRKAKEELFEKRAFPQPTLVGLYEYDVVRPFGRVELEKAMKFLEIPGSSSMTYLDLCMKEIDEKLSLFQGELTPLIQQWSSDRIAHGDSVQKNFVQTFHLARMAGLPTSKNLNFETIEKFIDARVVRSYIDAFFELAPYYCAIHSSDQLCAEGAWVLRFDRILKAIPIVVELVQAQHDLVSAGTVAVFARQILLQRDAVTPERHALFANLGLLLNSNKALATNAIAPILRERVLRNSSFEAYSIAYRALRLAPAGVRMKQSTLDGSERPDLMNLYLPRPSSTEELIVVKGDFSPIAEILKSVSDDSTLFEVTYRVDEREKKNRRFDPESVVPVLKFSSDSLINTAGLKDHQEFLIDLPTPEELKKSTLVGVAPWSHQVLSSLNSRKELALSYLMWSEAGQNPSKAQEIQEYQDRFFSLFGSQIEIANRSEIQINGRTSR